MVPALVARNLDLWCLLIVALGLGYAALSRRDRFPMETWMLGVAMIVLPLCSSVLASFNRFAFADWVLFPVYASAIGRLPKPWRIASMSAIAVACILAAYAVAADNSGWTRVGFVASYFTKPDSTIGPMTCSGPRQRARAS